MNCGSSAPGTFGNLLIPTPSQEIGPAIGRRFIKLALATMALADDGRIVTWGSQTDGLGGTGTPLGANIPLLSPATYPLGNVTQLVNGPNTYIIASGQLWAAGPNTNGIIGDGGADLRYLNIQPAQDLWSQEIVQVVGTIHSTYARTKDGRFLGWGRDINGNGGYIDMIPSLFNETGFFFGKKVMSVAVGQNTLSATENHVLIVTEDGLVYGRGQNNLVCYFFPIHTLGTVG